MKILNAGTDVLDDYDVLKFIHDKRAQHEADKKQAKEEKRPATQRPANFLKALSQHEAHILDKDRAFLNNPKYDNDSKYLAKLMQTLAPRVQLTKSEYLMLVNHRPYRRTQLSAMIEDVDARFSLDEQNFIRDAVVEILGIRDDVEPNQKPTEIEVKG